MADMWGATNATTSGEWETFAPTPLRDLLSELDRLRRENRDALRWVAAILLAAGGRLEVSVPIDIDKYEVAREPVFDRDAEVWTVMRPEGQV